MKELRVRHVPPKRRKPKNSAEGQFFELAKQSGFVAVKRGWPDFHLLTSDGRLICVEIKCTDAAALKFDQFQVLKGLAIYGVPCYCWSPRTGFLQILPNGKTRPATSQEVLS